MVEYVNAEGRARFFQPPGHHEIFLAGRRIAGWVIVHEDDRLGRVLDHGAEDLARVNQATVKRTNAYQVRADDMKLDVQGDNVKFLLGRVIGPPGKLVAAELKSLDGVRDAGNAVLVLGETHGERACPARCRP